MEDIVSQPAKEADKNAAEQIIEAQIKILSVSYDKSIAYTNLITVAGYASFFGLWQITKDNLSSNYSIWAALLIAISAATFVLFEVTKNYFQSRNMQKLNKIVTDPEIANSAVALQTAFDNHNKRLNRQIVFWGYWWHFSWLITVATGVTAIGLLLWAFITHLLAVQP